MVKALIDYIAALDEDAKTLTIYGITAESTTDEAIQKVQDRMNVFTESIYNTHIILRLYTEDEYEQVIDETIVSLRERKAEEDKRSAARTAALKALNSAGFPSEWYGTLPEDQPAETTPVTEAETAAETESGGKKEYEGVRKTKYPEEEGTQFDIFLIKGFDMFKKYQDILSPLDSYLGSGKNRMLSQYIYPTLLGNARVDGATLAIPVNHPIGEYEYAFINKELADKYSYDVDYFVTTAQVEEFIKDIVKHEPDVEPMYGEFTPYVDPFVSEIPYLGMGLSGSTSNAIGNLLNQPAVVAALRTSLTYGDDTEITAELLSEQKGQFAVAGAKGNYSFREIADSDDYYTVVLQQPLANKEEVFESLFAVSHYTRNVDRAVEILTYINTDPEFANLFHYGLEDEHYEINDDGLVERLNDEYMMGLYDTGNVYMLTPSTDMDPKTLAMAEDNWADSKLQNLDSNESAYIDYHFDYLDFNFTTQVVTKRVYYRMEKDPETGKEVQVEYEEEIVNTYRPMTESYPEAVEICAQVMADLEAAVLNENGKIEYEGREMVPATFIQTLGNKLRQNKGMAELMQSNNPNAFANFLYRDEMGTWDGNPMYDLEYIAEE